MLLNEDTRGVVTHLHHLEDLPLTHGPEGMRHAVLAAKHIDHVIRSGQPSNSLTTKYDGSPALVYGHHPRTKKFFVATKSAFNVTPKINYTHSDIDKNHGHSPGLASKLHYALDHLPAASPRHGVFQGDMMFDHGDVTHHRGGSVSFNPNPSGLTYHAHGHEAEKVRRAKIGVVTHMKYHGSDIGKMHATPNVDHDAMAKHAHSDVYTVDPRHPIGHETKKNYLENHARRAMTHLAIAQRLHDRHGDQIHVATKRHQGEGGHLVTYINHTVRTGEEPSVKGFQEHLYGKFNHLASKLKTDAGRKKYVELGVQHIQHVDTHGSAYTRLFGIHHHLAAAKNHLVTTLNSHQQFGHTHAGEAANPEGYVAHTSSGPVKLVNRQEFSRRNFAGRDRGHAS